MAKYFYPVIFHKEETGSYSVFVPDLPGCNTEGESLDIAYEMTADAIGLYLEGKEESEYPTKSDPKTIALEENEFIALVEFSKLKYDKKHNTKAVKKNINNSCLAERAGRKRTYKFFRYFTRSIERKIRAGLAHQHAVYCIIAKNR